MNHDAHVLLMRSRNLRKSMTREEKHLYFDGLKEMHWKFRRQVVLGHYIVDFCCPQLRIVVEVDGTQHFLESGLAYDQTRDGWLNANGYRVLRYSNEAVNHRFEAVCEEILAVCEKREAEMKKPPCR